MIEGRSRIEELEKFVNQVSAHNQIASDRKRILATFRMLVPLGVGETDASNAYQKYCDEMVTDRRAGICNINKDVQIYIIPPALKDAITLLRSFQSSENRGVLFGVAIVRAQGPDEYVHAMSPYVTEKEIHAMKFDSKESKGLEGGVGSAAAPVVISESGGPERKALIPLVTPSVGVSPPQAPQRPIGAPLGKD
jgi:hypothetical protein